MDEDNKPRCRACGKTDFILVGGFVVSNSGIPFQPYMPLKQLVAADYALTRELVECKGCGRKSLLKDAVNGEVAAVRWELSDQNTSRAIVCPKCLNRTHFVRTLIRAFTVLEYVKIENGEIIEPETGDETKIDEITVRYTCNVDGCDGSVELRTPDYRLTKA